jgi:hypothetical protein
VDTTPLRFSWLDKLEVETLRLLFLPRVLSPIESLATLAAELFGDVGLWVVVPIVIANMTYRTSFALLDLYGEDFVAISLQPIRFALFEYST